MACGLATRATGLMSESPIFIKTYDLIRWLVPKTVKYSREYRFSLALPIQEHVYTFQRHLVEAAKAEQKHDKVRYLQQANIELTLLRYKIRLSRDWKVLNFAGYEHASCLLDEIGRLLGGWLNSVTKPTKKDQP